jgi:hypothetical protein
VRGVGSDGEGEQSQEGVMHSTGEGVVSDDDISDSPALPTTLTTTAMHRSMVSTTIL